MGKRRRPQKLTDQLRQAIRDAGVTRYRIWQDTGIYESTLSKFMSGERGLSMDVLDRLGEYLELEITIRHKTLQRKKR